MAGVEIVFYKFAQLCSRHFGHHHVAYHNAGHLVAHQFPAFFSVGSCQYLVEWFEDIGKHFPDGIVVFYD